MLVGDARVVQHGWEIVRRQGVAADLAKASHAKDADESATSAVCVPEFVVVPPLLVASLSVNLRHHLLKLKLHHGVVLVALAVIGGQNFSSLINLVLGHEPSWRLGKPPDAQDNDARSDHLAPDGNAPRRVGVDVAAAVNNPAGNDGSDVPSAIVKTSYGTTPAGMRHLANIARGRYTAEADAKTEDETAAEELATLRARGLHACADDNDQGAGEHSHSSSEVVVCWTSEENRSYGTDVVHGKDEASARIRDNPVVKAISIYATILAFGNLHSKVVLVRFHTIESSHQAAILSDLRPENARHL